MEWLSRHAKGKWITLEGGEGSGKTSQTRALTEALKKQNINVLATREPGGTKNAEQIRALLVNVQQEPWLAQTELLLMNAARIEHIERVIKPALAEGTWVICDRFVDSSVAYQGAGRNLTEEYVWQMHRMICANALPDLTVFFDIAPRDGLARANKRMADKKNAENNFEQQGLEFHERVYKSFQNAAAKNPQRIHSIDARKSVEEVTAAAWKIITKRFAL